MNLRRFRSAPVVAALVAGLGLVGCTNSRAATDSLEIGAAASSPATASTTTSPATGGAAVATVKMTGTTMLTLRLTFDAGSTVELGLTNLTVAVLSGRGLSTVSVSRSVVTLLATLGSSTDTLVGQIPLRVDGAVISGASGGAEDAGTSATIDVGAGPVPLTFSSGADTPFRAPLP